MRSNRLLKHPRARRYYFRMKDARLSEQERRVEWHLRRYLNEQRDRLLERMPTDRKGLGDVIFNKEEEKKLLKTAIAPVIRSIAIEEGKDTAARFGVDFEVTSRVEEFISERSADVSDSITETTFSQIQRELEKATEEGLDYNDMGRRLEEKYDEVKDGRGKVIARTESHTAATKADYEAMRQAGIESKIWVAVLDDVTRPEHAAMDGTEIPIDRDFELPDGTNIHIPGDGPPEHSINCRCRI